MTLNGTKYSRYGVDGNYHDLWCFKSTVESLTAFIQDDTQSIADKNRAAEVLNWVVEYRSAHAGLEPGVVDFLVELNLPEAWWSSDYQLKDVTTDGVTRRDWVRVKPFAPFAPTPTVKVQSAPVVDYDELGEL